VNWRLYSDRGFKRRARARNDGACGRDIFHRRRVALSVLRETFD
jgi:hypothetical protein